MMKRYSVCLVLFLSACGGYSNPGVSDAQAQRDSRECAYEAQRATVNIYNLGEQIGECANLNAACMAARGYRYGF